MLCEVQQFRSNVGHHCAVGYLREKGVEAKQARLRLILKNIKNSDPIKMDFVTRQACKNRSASVTWQLDSTHKLVKYKFEFSGAVDGFSRYIMWIKYSNNNRVNTSYDLLKEAIDEKAAPLQVRGDKGSENRLMAKHMVIARNAKFRGHI